jgi:hypothetical protein
MTPDQAEQALQEVAYHWLRVNQSNLSETNIRFVLCTIENPCPVRFHTSAAYFCHLFPGQLQFQCQSLIYSERNVEFPGMKSRRRPSLGR